MEEEKPQLKAIGDHMEATGREAVLGPLQLTPAIDRTADDLDICRSADEPSTPRSMSRLQLCTDRSAGPVRG